MKIPYNIRRLVVYFLFCITTRLIIAYLIKKFHSDNVYKYMISAFLFIAGIVWLYLFFSGMRQYGREVFNESEEYGKIWWNSLRPVHSILYLLAVYLILFTNYSQYAWIMLVVDVIIGGTFTLVHELSQ